MGAWAPLLQGPGGRPLLGVQPGSSSPTTTTTTTTTTRGATSSSFTRRSMIARNGGGGEGPGGATPPSGRALAARASSPSINGSSPPEPGSWQQKKKKKATTTTQKQQQTRQSPSVLEIQRAIGVASGEDDGGGNARGDGGSQTDSVLDFFASTPIGQAESPTERKLREAAEWVVERIEARGAVGQRILMVVCLNILPVWVFLLLVASGAVKLPFSLPFMDDLLS